LAHASPCGQAAPGTNDQPPHLALRPGTSVSECRLSAHTLPCGQATLQVNCRHPHLALRPGISVSECQPSTHTSPCGQVALQVNCQPSHPALRSGTSVGGVDPLRDLTLRPGNDTGSTANPVSKPSGDDWRWVDNGSASCTHPSLRSGGAACQSWAPLQADLLDAHPRFQPVTLARLWIGCGWSGRHPLPSK